MGLRQKDRPRLSAGARSVSSFDPAPGPILRRITRSIGERRALQPSAMDREAVLTSPRASATGSSRPPPGAPRIEHEL